MTSLHIEDALNFLIEQLAAISAAAPANALARQRTAHGSDIWVNDVCDRYWQTRGQVVADMAQDDKSRTSLRSTMPRGNYPGAVFCALAPRFRQDRRAETRSASASRLPHFLAMDIR